MTPDELRFARAYYHFKMAWDPTEPDPRRYRLSLRQAEAIRRLVHRLFESERIKTALSNQHNNSMWNQKKD